jgi:hypothetical protein
MDPRIRIHTKTSWIRNTACNLTCVFQVANIGPITYSLLRNWRGCAPRPHLVIILLLILGIGASLGRFLAPTGTPHKSFLLKKAPQKKIFCGQNSEKNLLKNRLSIRVRNFAPLNESHP